MAGVKIPARDITLQVEDGSGSFVEIAGLNSATVNPSENEEVADTTTFGSQGMYEQQVMQRGATIELEGFLLKDATGAQDPGQARCETLATKVGSASLGVVQFSHPNDADWTEWDATVTIGEKGGGNNEMTTWTATLTRSGASRTVAKA